ncbi:MAG: addiction module protein [Planctomycetota bacterium]
MSNAASEIREKLPSLNEAERLQLLLDIWSSLAGTESATLSDEDRRQLDARLAEYEADPTNTIPAETVISRLRAKDRG